MATTSVDKLISTALGSSSQWGSRARVVDGTGSVYAFKNGVARQPKEIQGTTGAKWDEIERAGMKPILRFNSPKLRTVQYKIVVGANSWKTSVESHVNWFVARSEWQRRVRFAGMGSPTLETGRWWQITDCNVEVSQRTPSGDISRATITLTLTEASWLPPTAVAKVKRPTKKKTKKKKKAKKRYGLGAGKKKKVRTYKVKKGDTLWDLARKFYGNPYKWKVLAKRNKVKNVRRLQIGKKLVIP